MTTNTKNKSSLRAIRTEKKISQKELSDMTGISIRCIKYYESLAQTPTLINAYKISQSLDADIETIFPYNEITNNA
jgi:DNA-binding XRE family transcriptional regulator